MLLSFSPGLSPGKANSEWANDKDEQCILNYAEKRAQVGGMQEKIGIIGAGKLGHSFARALCEAGCLVAAINDADITRAKCCAALCGENIAACKLKDFPSDITMLFIAVPDDAVPCVVEQLAASNFISPRTIIAHTSGALPSAVLAPLRDRSKLLAAIHPVQTLTEAADDWRRLFGIYYGIEGFTRALPRLRALIQKLHSKVFIIPENQKALYHLGCVFASNYLVGVEAIAARIMKQAGFTEKEAVNILEPLVLATLENIKRHGMVRSLTGPIVRGDLGTVKRHVEEIETKIPAFLPPYLILGQTLIDLAGTPPRHNQDILHDVQTFIRAKQKELLEQR